MSKKLLITGIILLGGFLIATLFAGQISAVTDINVQKPPLVQATDVGSIIRALIGIVLIVAAIVFFFMLLLGGLQWITSGGDKAGVEGARSRLTAAFIGLVIVFSAWAIMSLVENFLGVEIFGKSIAIPSVVDQQQTTSVKKTQ